MRAHNMLILLIALVAGYAVGYARLTRQTPTEAQAARFAAHDRTAYTLPSGKLERAVALDRTGRTLVVAETLGTPAQLVLILALGVVARMRDWAVGLSRYRWVQGFAFVFLLLLAMQLLDLPLEIYGHRVGLSYGLSVQGWGSWLADKGKMFALEWIFGGLTTMLIFLMLRKWPTRWWFWFWIPAVFILVSVVFVSPYVFDPLFNQFEPLGNADPALVQRLEEVVARAGISIPPERMFLMRASAKSTELNAYVTGFGASKRVVVWDTTIAHSTPDEIAFIFAHEMGHYALGHVVLGVALTCVGLLPLFWIGYRCVRVLLGRYGAAWGISAQQDWGALVVILLVAAALSTLTEPVANGFSRAIEHNADVYGQEAVHGIIADPQAVGRRSFQVLGEESLDDPTPHPVFEWWFGTHPTIRFRTAFAEAYDPWAVGEQAKYFAK